MKYKLFITLYEEALEYDDLSMYISERGWQEWMDQFKEDNLGKVLTLIYNLSKMSVKEMRESKGISRAEFSRVHGIPSRTLQDWDLSVSSPTNYLKAYIAYTFFIEELQELV